MTAAAPRPWDAVPLDVDGVLTLADHRAVCSEPARCPFCMGLDDAAPSAERGATA